MIPEGLVRSIICVDRLSGIGEAIPIIEKQMLLRTSPVVGKPRGTTEGNLFPKGVSRPEDQPDGLGEAKP